MSYLKNDEFIITRKELEEIESLKNHHRKCLDSAKAKLIDMQLEIDRLKNNLHDMNNGMSCGNCKSFQDEDVLGRGNCIEFNNTANTNDCCERWEEKDG